MNAIVLLLACLAGDIKTDVNQSELLREVEALLTAQEELLDEFIEKVKKRKRGHP